MTNEEIHRQLDEIGFKNFVHLAKEKRDDKIRWTWTYPIEQRNDWFLVLLVEEHGNLSIEKLTNPLGKTFEKKDVENLLKYIRSDIWKY